MSKAQLKKTLAGMDLSAVTEMICELYDARPEAKEYLEFWLKPDVKKELEKYKVRIHRLFFTSSGKPRKRPTITSIKKELKYFSTICFEPEFIADLYIFLVETDLQWLRERRNPSTSIKSVKGNYELCRQYIEASGEEDRYAIKLERFEEELEEMEKRAEKMSGYGWRRWRW